MSDQEFGSESQPESGLPGISYAMQGLGRFAPMWVVVLTAEGRVYECADVFADEIIRWVEVTDEARKQSLIERMKEN